MTAAAYDERHDLGYGLGLHHIQLSVPPGVEDACRAFWIDALGFLELRKPPQLAAKGGIWIRADDLEVHIGVEEDFRPAKKAHPGIRVGDLDKLVERLSAHGITVTWDDNFPGYRRCYTADNAGNRLEFLEATGDAVVW